MFAASTAAERATLAATGRPGRLDRAHPRTFCQTKELREEIRNELARLSPAYGFDVMAEQYLRLIDQWNAPPHRPVRTAVQTDFKASFMPASSDARREPPRSAAFHGSIYHFVSTTSLQFAVISPCSP